MDLSRPVVVAEYGPGEGCHTREMLKRAHPESKFLLFELDPEFCPRSGTAVRRRSARDGDQRRIAPRCPRNWPSRTSPIATTCCPAFRSARWRSARSGRFFKTRTIRSAPGGDFVIYQVTNELRGHATPTIFPRADSEYFLTNVPPMFITVFHKDAVPADKALPPQSRQQRPPRQEPTRAAPSRPIHRSR